MYYAIKLFDVENSGPLRDQYRQPHLDYLKQFDDQTLFAGPFLTTDLATELGSYRLIEFPDRKAAEEHVANEPSLIGGAQKGAEICDWSPSVPYNWRDCPRKEGNVQYLIEAIDKPDSAELRDSLRAEHEAFQKSVEDIYITRGPLLEQGSTQQIGSVMIIDVPDLEAAVDFWENEPFNTGGLFEKVGFYGWRFGRVMDRFKS